jgi:hypothetical protein
LDNQFSSSIKHKPFANDIDKARTLGFISALRNVLAGVPKVELKEPETELFPTRTIEDQKEINRKGLESLRKHKEGNIND